MKIMKTALVAVMAMTMFTGAAHAGLGSMFKATEKGFAKMGNAVKSAPGKAASGVKAGYQAYDRKVAQPAGGAIIGAGKAVVKAPKQGWDALVKHVGTPMANGLTDAAKATQKGVVTVATKTSDAIGGNILRGGKKAVKAVKRLFKR